MLLLSIFVILTLFIIEILSINWNRKELGEKGGAVQTRSELHQYMQLSHFTYYNFCAESLSLVIMIEFEDEEILVRKGVTTEKALEQSSFH
eukprot:gene5123-3677_t